MLYIAQKVSIRKCARIAMLFHSQIKSLASGSGTQPEQKLLNYSYITEFYFAIIYRGYHQNDLYTLRSRLRGRLPILGNKNPDVNLVGKGVKMG